MTNNKQRKASKTRTQVKDLPKDAKELSAAEAKKVKGGGWLMSPAGHDKPPQTPPV